MRLLVIYVVHNDTFCRFPDSGAFFLFQVFPSSVITLLQSDIKTALKSAFGQSDGPLSVTDWCKGRNQSGDGGSISEGSTAESALTEGRTLILIIFQSHTGLSSR